MLNVIGLILNISGVALLFVYGFPQPTHEEGVALCLEDNTKLPDGSTVAEHDAEVRATKSRYFLRSRLALGLIILGFGFQLWSTLYGSQKLTARWDVIFRADGFDQFRVEAVSTPRF